MISREPRGRAVRVGTILALALAAGYVLVDAGAARAESCAYDPVRRAVTAAIDPGAQATLVVSAGELRFGAIPAPCGGATTTNTDSVSIAGAAGTIETLILDQRGGPFGPGATAEANTPEIEIATSLGDASDRVTVYGTEGADFMAAGQNGFATSSDGDVDVTFAPGAFSLEVHLLGGDDYFNGRGESGAGLHFLGPIRATGGAGNESLLRGSSEPDNLDGGPGNDVLRGQEADDVLTGGDGDDSLGGGGENDVLSGGPGVDEFLGSSGDDRMYAQSDDADLSINGGPGFDTGYLDVVDPVPSATEIVIRPSESCNYDGTTRALSLTMTPTSTVTLRVVDGAIWYGEVPRPCASATTTNVDSISIEGAVGTSETLILDQRGGMFAPGATPEFNTSEIEITTALGDASDRVIVYGTEGDDYFAAGQNGFATSTDGDVDFTFAPSAFGLEVHLGGGNDYFDARGTGGAGLQFLGPIVSTGGPGSETLIRGGKDVDSLDGGDGDDVIEGTEGNDTIAGRAGNDTLTGGGGDDRIDGGAGVDTFNGNDGADTLVAQDDEADALISGGAGADTAYVDTGVDPTPVTVETVFGDGSPPPPPATACAYDSVKKTVTATLAAGAQARVVVVGGAIHFGAVPTACGAATTSNTDSITANGASGSIETLTIDYSGGDFAPGATAETDAASEIELSVLLGDASDALVVIGSNGPDTIAVGTRGVALNADADAEITYAPVPSSVEVFGLAGPNTLSARGGDGSGTTFTGMVVLHAGDSGDTLRGGLGGDVLFGGAGNDGIEGREGNDTITGGGGDDTVAGNGENDDLTGGAGADTLLGSDGDDILRANDGVADVNLHGGSGTDTAYYDDGVDPAPIAVEFRVTG